MHNLTKERGQIMRIEEALQLVTNICSDFKGNLKDHQLIQQALSIIEDVCKKQEVKVIDNTTDMDS